MGIRKPCGRLIPKVFVASPMAWADSLIPLLPCGTKGFVVPARSCGNPFATIGAGVGVGSSMLIGILARPPMAWAALPETLLPHGSRVFFLPRCRWCGRLPAWLPRGSQAAHGAHLGDFTSRQHGAKSRAVMGATPLCTSVVRSPAASTLRRKDGPSQGLGRVGEGRVIL